MAEQWYAVVFRKRWGPGEHWHDHLPEPAKGERRIPFVHRAAPDDTDRRQDWTAGEVYSVGTVIADPLPAHLEAIKIDGPQNGRLWNKIKKRYEADPAAPPDPGAA